MLITQSSCLNPIDCLMCEEIEVKNDEEVFYKRFDAKYEYKRISESKDKTWEQEK